MVDTLKYNYPDAKIDFLVNKRVYELIQDYPNINKVHTIEKDTIKDIKQICHENNYDLAIAVHPSFPVAMGLFRSGVKYRLGTAYRWYSFLFNIRHKQHRKDSIKHELEYNLDLLNELNCKQINGLSPHIEVKEEILISVKNKLKANGIDLTKDYVVIHVPSLSSAKVWSDKNFVDLINMILKDKEPDFNIILSGTKGDEVQVKSVIGKLEKNDRVFGVFELNLKELAGLLKMAKFFVGNSTGPIHIAVAVGTFVIGLYSPVKVESPARWGPYTERKKVFVPEQKDNSRDVMDDIKPDIVYRFIKSYFS
jgi:ADP-heptose:LPS heptosyltransferase